jgi:hypothetical protein
MPNVAGGAGGDAGGQSIFSQKLDKKKMGS